jgi:hypothetical protein
MHGKTFIFLLPELHVAASPIFGWRGVPVCAYLAGAASVAGFAAGASAVFALAFSFFAVCAAFLCLATCSAFGAAVVAAGVAAAAGAAGVAGAAFCANTGNVRAESRAIATMDLDFMAIFLKDKEKFLNLGVCFISVFAAPYFH